MPEECHSARDAESTRLKWIPAFTGVTDGYSQKTISQNEGSSLPLPEECHSAPDAESTG
ncbi:MAG: hypothetical protein VX798_02850 [Bacteroidota bacterium]|nr:hypothetical protein [Bacteroidota bacterium]